MEVAGIINGNEFWVSFSEGFPSMGVWVIICGVGVLHCRGERKAGSIVVDDVAILHTPFLIIQFDVEEFPHTNEADRKDCARLYLAALKGSWESVEKMSKVQREITITKETTLHIAAGANKEEFVKQLLIKMKDDKLKALNTKGNTALCYAAATGNVNIAELMLNQSKDLANVGSVKPLFIAAFSGHADMVNFLSPRTNITEWDITEQVELFVTYASVGMYEQALHMLKKNPSLATRKNNQDKTALHVLALKPSAFVSGSQPGILRRWINSCELF
ncbi:isoform 2 of ankyrin repeat domain-containing protein 17 [Fagus crenata]